MTEEINEVEAPYFEEIVRRAPCLPDDNGLCSRAEECKHAKDGETFWDYCIKNGVNKQGQVCGDLA